MKRDPMLLCLAVPLAVWAGSVANGQVLRDAVIIGGQHYLRTQRVTESQATGSWTAPCVVAQGGVATYTLANAVVFQGNSSADIYMRGFDEWANPTYAPVRVSPEAHITIFGLMSARWGEANWAMWYENYDGEWWARVVDNSGVPWGPPVLLFSGYSPQSVHIDLDSARVAVALGAVGSGSYTQYDQFLRVFTLDGTPLSDVISIAATPVSEEYSCAAVMSDGAVLVSYRVEDGGHYHAYLRRVNPDFTLEPPVLATPVELIGLSLRGPANGTVLGCYHTGNGAIDGHYAQRFDGFGQAVGGAMPLDRDGFADATSDGRIAVAGDDGELWVRFNDVAGTPLSERFYFPTGSLPTTHTFQDVHQALAYDDDGTVWIAWRAVGPIFSNNCMLTSLKPFTPGDMNGDGVVNNLDINGFVWALLTPEVYEQHYPGVPYHILGDFTGDNVLNNQDINGFVAALFGG